MRALSMMLCLYLGLFACRQGPAGRRAPADTALLPGYVRTTPRGYRMYARVGTASWAADQMLAFGHSGWTIRIEGASSGTAMGFTLWLPGLRTNDRVGFFAGSAADLMLRPSGEVWKGTSGEVHILRIDPWVLEGNFRFSAVLAEKDSMIPVSEGYFRVPLDAPEP